MGGAGPTPDSGCVAAYTALGCHGGPASGQVGKACGFDGEQGDLVGAYVVGLAGQLADRVVGDDDVGAEVADVGEEAADRFVEGSVDEPGLAGRGLGLRASL